MSYTKKTWASGETVTSSAMNNMETGIANAYPFMVTITLVNGTFKSDKTYAEIVSANNAGEVVRAIYDNGTYEVEYILTRVDSTYVVFSSTFSANNNGSTKITINSSGNVTRSTITFYDKPNTGIPETDLAQAVQDKLNTFIVTLTPTAQDYSGTMDKTVAEIQTAYDAGKSIVFRIVTGVNEYTDIPCAFASKFANYTYMNFAANLFLTTMNLLIVAETFAGDNGTKQTYGTTIYPLTPMS